MIDIEADQAVIWRGPTPRKARALAGPNGETDRGRQRQPMEVYLEGNVIVRQDEHKVAGKGDQRTFRADRGPTTTSSPTASSALDAEIDMFAPGFIAPMQDQVAADRAVPRAGPAARRHPQSWTRTPRSGPTRR